MLNTFKKEKYSITRVLAPLFIWWFINGGAKTGKEFLRKGEEKVCIAKK